MRDGHSKILIFMGSMGRGGAERVISLLSDFLIGKGWDVSIALLLSNKIGYEINSKVKIIDLSTSKSRFLSIPHWLNGIKGAYKREKPNVILSFAARINVLVQIGLKKAPIVLSERNDPFLDGRSFFIDILTKMNYPKAALVIFQTQRASSYFPKLKNASVISNPISVTDVAICPSSSHKIVAAGRLTSQKNHKLLIDAFAKIAPIFPDYYVEIYGQGELELSLKELISHYGLEKRVFLMGNVPNLHERIKDAAIYVLSSNYEGLSNSLLEAMMMGLPCISTNCAGSTEYISDHEDGLLVNVGDTNALSDALKELISNKELRNRIGHNAQLKSINWSKELILEKWYSALKLAQRGDKNE